MRILWVTQWFPPDLGALPARLTEMARVWIEEGHEVTVVTAFPHHPLGVIPAQYRGKRVVEEQYNGIRVIRCWLWALPNKRMWQRTLCQISFAITSVLLALRRPENPDIVIVSSPPFFTVAAGWIFSRWRRAPLVFEVRDLWPAVFAAVGIMSEGLAYRLLEKLEMAFYRAARKIVVVTSSFRKHIAARGIPEEKIAVIPNGADPEFFAPRPPSAELRRELGGEGKFLVTYVGTHGLLTGLEQILEAAEWLRDQPEFAFAFVGEGAERENLIDESRRRGLTNVLFHSAVPKERMPEVYAASDACLVCLRPLPIFRLFIPSKVFEILSCGRPLVAALSGEAAEIVRDAGAIVVEPGSGRAIAEALQALRGDPDRRRKMEFAERQYVQRHYDRRDLARRYLDVLSEIART